MYQSEVFGVGFSFFGIVAYGIWSLYLLWCCVKGNIKLGLRFLIWKVTSMFLNVTKLMNRFDQ